MRFWVAHVVWGVMLAIGFAIGWLLAGCAQAPGASHDAGADVVDATDEPKLDLLPWCPSPNPMCPPYPNGTTSGSPPPPRGY